MSTTVSKTDLIAMVAEETGNSKKATAEVINSLVETVARCLLQEDQIRLSGLGTFKVAERAARTGRNPQTGAVLKIAASKAPKFAFASTIKAAMKELKVAKKAKK